MMTMMIWDEFETDDENGDDDWDFGEMRRYTILCVIADPEPIQCTSFNTLHKSNLISKLYNSKYNKNNEPQI